MPLITSSRYSAVAATLPRDGAAHHHSTNTSPNLVVSITSDGAINGDLHRAPITGVTRIKHPSAGFYILKGPGLTLRPSDSEVCSVVDYLSATATVDAVKHALAVHVFDASGNPANIAFRCAFWKIPALS
jgi:hypothetical protein